MASDEVSLLQCTALPQRRHVKEVWVLHGDWSTQMDFIVGFGGCFGREFGQGLEGSLEWFL